MDEAAIDLRAFGGVQIGYWNHSARQLGVWN